VIGSYLSIYPLLYKVYYKFQRGGRLTTRTSTSLIDSRRWLPSPEPRHRGCCAEGVRFWKSSSQQLPL